MGNWTRLVEERLERKSLTPEERADVIAEIAAHLEDCHAQALVEGHADPEGATTTQVADWDALGRAIRRAKEVRMRFVRQVMVPGIGAALLAQAVLQASVFMLVTPEPCGPDATCVAVSANTPAYWLWLTTLPVIGACAAWLAGRLGANARHRLLAAVAPACYLGLETTVMSTIDAFYWRIAIYWVLIPALACAVGAWPRLSGRQRVPQASPATPAHA